MLPGAMALGVDVRRGGWIALAVLTLAASCGRTTRRPGVDDETREGDGGTAGVPEGGDASGAGLGGTHDGGSGFAGNVPQAGALTGGVAQEGGQGGGESTCDLVPGDCRREDEVACVSHPSCSGDVLAGEIYAHSPAELMTVTRLAAAHDGGVVAAGLFNGKLEFGGDVAPLVADPEVQNLRFSGAAFIASFSAEGAVKWAHAVDGPGMESPTAIGVTSSGVAVMTLAGDGAEFTHSPALVAADERGVRFREPLGTRLGVSASAMWVGKDDEIWVSGFLEKLDYRDVHLTSPDSSGGYLLRVDSEGNALEAGAHPFGGRVVMDDQGDLIMVWIAGNAEPGPRGLLQKRTRSGEVVFTSRFQIEKESTRLNFVHLAVDRRGRITVARSFAGTFENEGETFRAGKDPDVWIAQYHANGELAWQQSFERDGAGTLSGSEIASLSIDPFDNVLLLGGARRIAVGDRVAQSSHESEYLAYVVKLRPDGSSSFLRWFEGDVALGALTADASGRLWLGGSARGEVWADDGERTIVTGQGALLLRLRP
jgi:hypothetical protein